MVVAVFLFASYKGTIGAIAGLALLLGAAQLLQNSRGDLGLYYLSPYSWAFTANPIADRIGTAVEVQEWLLAQTTREDQILSWVDGQWVDGDRELYVVAGMQLWGENRVTLEPTMTDEDVARTEHHQAERHRDVRPVDGCRHALLVQHPGREPADHTGLHRLHVGAESRQRLHRHRGACLPDHADVDRLRRQAPCTGRAVASPSRPPSRPRSPSSLSLIVFGPLLDQLDVGWAGGDMLSTYVNSVNWGGFAYTVTTQFGFPLGMNLNYFPGIDITENTFALVVNTIAGTTFLGINLLILLSFPLVAALAYLVIRLTGMQGPVAIALAVAFTFIPFHWGRALGHTYLSTLYSAVIGLALVLLVGSGLFERLLRTGSRRRRIAFVVAVVVMVVTVAWTGVYYVAFTLILGAAALLWRFAQRARWQSIAPGGGALRGHRRPRRARVPPRAVHPSGRPTAGEPRRAPALRVGRLRRQPRQGAAAAAAERDSGHGLLQPLRRRGVRRGALRRERRHHQPRHVDHRRSPCWSSSAPSSCARGVPHRSRRPTRPPRPA